jgi:hypothetical protein
VSSAQRAVAASLLAPRLEKGIDTKPDELKAPKATGSVQGPAHAPQAPVLDQLAAIMQPHTHLAATRTDAPPTRSHAVTNAIDSVDAAAPAQGPADLPPSKATPFWATPTEARAIEAPAQLAPALQITASAVLEDPSLRVVMLPNVARVSVDTADAGRVSIQVKMKDGIADISATGPAAPLVEARQGELRTALAKEGLSMGSFDSPSHGRGRHDAPLPREERPSPRLTSPPVRTSSLRDEFTHSGVHVKA